ncbi:uncharacterized SAM-binding protein YcdF (DUF218 family) [Actinoplanes lutulentus]|uniref:Uncharacterized SAM-binding protein YcdF (DUF218 family) n=1 Tax=Actinoplanes lutulentus TaxID=1287878 RepID=A0A327Z3B0_9ACTN|nr:YdcF family protein [Actinoplanes lutulentus]MBB2948852.1 uncharacterized SAM-binding protein YcdF (DUF218 family) [Actinoplanes lutulentus]RAK29762.1 uncharacterized SAM-binding protein YcdF (DUF218 family) [Actinoplanes lutulentus]
MGSNRRGALGIAIGALLILDAVIVLFTISINSGIIATFVMGALYLFSGLYRDRIRDRTRKGPLKWVKIVILIANALMVLSVASIAIFGRVDTVSYEEDALVVLGTGLNGEEVTPSLRSRLEVAVEYAAANPGAVIAVSGGQGHGESITEALAMRRYLVAHGVSEDRILQENESTSTQENFVLTKRLLDAHFDAGYTTAFITSDYHILRANEIAEEAGIGSTHLHANTPWYQIPVDYTRELLAFMKFYLAR